MDVPLLLLVIQPLNFAKDVNIIIIDQSVIQVKIIIVIPNPGLKVSVILPIPIMIIQILLDQPFQLLKHPFSKFHRIYLTLQLVKLLQLRQRKVMMRAEKNHQVYNIVQ